jgi:hypothetical protein
MKLTEYTCPWIIWFADGEIVETLMGSSPAAEYYHKICTVYPGVDMDLLQSMFDDAGTDNLSDPIYVEHIFQEKKSLYNDELYPCSDD